MWLALNIVYILPRRVTVRLTGAVKFNRWKTELFGNVSVFNLQSFIHLKDRSGTRVISCLYIICFQSVQRFTHRFALHPLSGQRAGGNGRTTAKCFEPGIYYLPLVIHLNLSKEKLYLSHHHILKEENSIAVIQIYNLKLKKVSLLKCVIIKIIPLINTRWQQQQKITLVRSVVYTRYHYFYTWHFWSLLLIFQNSTLTIAFVTDRVRGQELETRCVQK